MRSEISVEVRGADWGNDSLYDQAEDELRRRVDAAINEVAAKFSTIDFFFVS